MKRILTCIILPALCLLFATTSDTLADGKFFPSVNRVSPTIHSQRAILKYKDGVETLVIESSFDGEGKDFGWVIPLPNKPTKFEQASPGFLKTLSETIQPIVIPHLSVHMTLAIFPAVIVGVFFLFSLISTNKRLICVLSLLQAVLLLPLIFVTTFAGAKGVGDQSLNRVGVDVLGIQEVGSFSLAVLEADDPQSLDEWLSNNDFAGLNKLEQQIISDYIKEGWCFVVAKLKRDGEGYTEPHPLAMTFEVEKPVYPMRLTAAADSEVFLELFVIADNYASCPTLTTEFASQYSYDSHLDGVESGYSGKRSDNIDHPKMNEYMWDKCVITRLCDFLGPEEMKEDIVVELNSGEDFQKVFFSSKGAIDLGLVFGLKAWCFVIIALSALFSSKKWSMLNWKGKIIKILIPATCLLLIVSACLYFSVDKIEGIAIPEEVLLSDKGV